MTLIQRLTLAVLSSVPEEYQEYTADGLWGVFPPQKLFSFRNQQDTVTFPSQEFSQIAIHGELCPILCCANSFPDRLGTSTTLHREADIEYLVLGGVPNKSYVS